MLFGSAASAETETLPLTGTVVGAPNHDVSCTQLLAVTLTSTWPFGFCSVHCSATDNEVVWRATTVNGAEPLQLAPLEAVPVRVNV